MKLYVTKKLSTKKNVEYSVLCCEKDGKEYFLSFDRTVMLRLTNMTLNDFDKIKLGEKLIIE